MNVSMNNSPNFRGFILYTNPDTKKKSTINTNDVVGIQQKIEPGQLESNEPTKVYVRNNIDNNNRDAKYVVYSFNAPVTRIVREYNRACKNEFLDYGRVLDIAAIPETTDSL